MSDDDSPREAAEDLRDSIIDPADYRIANAALGDEAGDDEDEDEDGPVETSDLPDLSDYGIAENIRARFVDAGLEDAAYTGAVETFPTIDGSVRGTVDGLLTDDIDAIHAAIESAHDRLAVTASSIELGPHGDTATFEVDFEAPPPMSGSFTGDAFGPVDTEAIPMSVSGVEAPDALGMAADPPDDGGDEDTASGGDTKLPSAVFWSKLPQRPVYPMEVADVVPPHPDGKTEVFAPAIGVPGDDGDGLMWPLAGLDELAVQTPNRWLHLRLDGYDEVDDDHVEAAVGFGKFDNADEAVADIADYIAHATVHDADEPTWTRAWSRKRSVETVDNVDEFWEAAGNRPGEAERMKRVAVVTAANVIVAGTPGEIESDGDAD